MFGQVAITLCMIAVALVGFVMLTGRLPVRRGMRVLVGCFVLLGAPVIAPKIGGVFMAGGQSDGPVRVAAPAIEQSAVGAREELPPAQNDPYAGASLRRE